MSSSNSSSRGIGFLGALQALFIGLKLCNVIAWSWLWVLAPLWGGVTLGVLLLILLALVIS